MLEAVSMWYLQWSWMVSAKLQDLIHEDLLYHETNQQLNLLYINSPVLFGYMVSFRIYK